MSEAAKVRVVRCPKCENLLPEVEDFSLYQCGGCGAVLKGKNKGVDLDGFSEKSDGERTEGIVGKKVNASDERKTDTAGDSEDEASSSISSSSRTERRRILRHRDENNGSPLMNNLKISDSEADSDIIRGKRSDEHRRANGLVRSGHLADVISAEKGEIQGAPWRPNRMDYDGTRHSMDSSSRHDHVHENRVRDMNGGNRMPGFNNFEYLGDDRVEALRKLDELKDQLSRSGHLIDKGKEKVPFDPSMVYHDRYAPEKYYPDPNFKHPPYQNHYAESFPSTKVQEMGGNRFYPPRYEYEPSHVQGLGDPLRSRSVRRRPHQDYAPYQAYVPGVVPYVDDGVPYMDKMKPYASNFSHHHPLCSCYQCLDNRQVPHPTTYREHGYAAYTPSDKMFSSHKNLGSSGPLDYYDRRMSSDPYLKLNNGGMSHMRWPSEVNSEVDGFVNHQRVQRVHLTPSKTQPMQHQLPIAGGAPFLTCYSCFELLVLPKRVEIKGCNSKGKIRCGACSTVIALVHSKESNSIVFSKESNSRSKDNLGNSVSTVGGKNPDKAGMGYSSDDYDSSDHGTANKFDEMKNRNSTSTCTSEVEEDREHSTAAAHKNENILTEDSRPPAGSPLQEHFEFSNKYHRVREGNGSVQPENDNVSLPKSKPGFQGKKDSSATEIDLSSSEYSNTGTTFDSGETSGEGEKLKHGGRSAESFLTGFLKRSVKDSNNRASEAPKQEKANVTVNGHLISDALVEKSQRLAGSIQPGNYWYDFRAGFWGVMGGPCLGIIPPFIEEFNYPMLEDCASGNTQVFVNGRELNAKDLKLLASRGLPTESHRSYIIEISGRVLDEDTGEELDNLGKLAPTVERAKRGFGMKVPKSSA